MFMIFLVVLRDGAFTDLGATLGFDFSTKGEEEMDIEEEDAEPDAKQAFEPGSIHKKQFFNYWKDELKAAPWVLNILEHGYKIPFKSYPPVYEERNNATARAEPEVVESLVTEMIEDGIVEVVSKKPHCVSPLGLVKKLLEDGTYKYRLVFDASRCVNLHLEEKHVSLSHLDKALELTEQGEFQSIFDLKSCYYQLMIHESHRRYLGACFIKGEKKIYFQYKHLPFGLASAVHVITKIMKPVVAKIMSQGIKFSIYIDDGRFLAATQEQADDFRTKVYAILESAGWQISKEKSDSQGQASTRKKYLGFVIDTEEMKVFVDEEKMRKIRKLVQDGLSNPVMPVKFLAKLQGNIISLIPSHGFIARVASKSGYVLIERHTSEFGWNGSVFIDKATQDEWRFFLDSLEASNGMPIRSQMNDIRVDAILQNPTTKMLSLPRAGTVSDDVWVSDASGFKVVAFNLCDREQHELSIMFTEEEAKMSSGFRELLAIQKTVQYWTENSSEAHKNHIFWCTDSTNVVSFLSKGSSKSHLQAVIFDIAKKLQKLNLIITPVHLLREDPRIKEADCLSKVKDSDDWSLDHSSFDSLDRIFGFTLDLFASATNKKTTKYFSEFLMPGTKGIDAFAQDWTNEVLWICPPVKFLIKVCLRVRKIEAEGVVIVPNWPTSSFYNFYFDTTGKPKPPFLEVKRWKPYIFQNQDAEGPLKGKVVFDFIALFFNTKKGNLSNHFTNKS